MSPKEIIQNAIPDVTDEVCEYIVWGRTPYPCVGLTAKALYKAASRLKRAIDNGNRLCDFCDRIATHGGVCKKCDDALKRPEP